MDVRAGSIEVGDRVVVRIVDAGCYARGAAAALDGMVGRVDRFRGDGEALVAFDGPARTWWEGQTLAMAFWLPPSDLLRVAA